MVRGRRLPRRDGFEGGNLLAWTGAVTDTGHLTVSTTAALKGSYGLRAYINDNNAMYVQDDTPSAEADVTVTRGSTSILIPSRWRRPTRTTSSTVTPARPRS